uniref:Filamin B, beta (actin binding protein 278) n=1 Tax=Sinocyclocheilus anshuiensis TaxID=1608454 RepID=A0A671QBH2_9TELE
DSKAIVDGNLKLILGLVWTLIQHYSISTPMWEDEANNSVSKLTPEMRLLGWIQNKVPELPITNFSQDWQDGKALGALVDGLAPGLCPDWESWDTVHRVSNTKEAMQQADDWLGIPQLIAPEEILDPAVDEQSVMTYLSLFPKARLKPGAPLKPKKDVVHCKFKREPVKSTSKTGKATNLYYSTYPTVAFYRKYSNVTSFVIINIFISNCNLITVPCKSFFTFYVALPKSSCFHNVYNLENLAYLFIYHPLMQFKISFSISFFFPVLKPKACHATGQGLQSKGMRVGQLAQFKVDTHKAGPGNLEVNIRDPSGKEVAVTQKDAHEGVYTFEYTPTATGDHTVDITWVGQHIAKSPFKVHVGSKAGPQKIRAWGPGLEGGTVGLSADFLVESVGADSGMLGFAIEGPSQAKIECDDHNDGSCLVRFWPTEAGEYAVHIMCDDEEIQDSPFMTSIRPKRKDFRPDQVKVEGQGVSQTGCILNLQTEFTVDTRRAGEGELKVYARRADGEFVDVIVASEQSGVFVCSYIPSSLSKHTIAVAWEGVMVPGSPFIVTLKYIAVIFSSLEACDCCTVRFCMISASLLFQVTPRRIKITPCSPVLFKPDGSEMYYSGKFKGTVFLKIPDLYGGMQKERAHGPGLKEGFLGEQAEFIIDTSRAGSGRLAIRVDGPCEVTLQCLDNQDGTCTVFYLPTEHGMYKINVLFDNSHITGSPFQSVIQKPIDPSKVLVTDLDLLQGKVGEPFDDLDITVEGPSECQVTCKDSGEGMYNVEYYPSVPGDYKITITCGENHIPEALNVCTVGSIELLEVTDSGDGSYTVVYLPTMDGCHVLMVKFTNDEILETFRTLNVFNIFIISHQVEGRNVIPLGAINQAGFLSCDIVLPSELSEGEITGEVITPSGKTAQPSVIDNKDGTIILKFDPSEEGLHQLFIKSSRNDLPELPLQYYANSLANRSTMAYGRGLVYGIANETATFTICQEDSASSERELDITIEGPSEADVRCVDNEDGTCTVSYFPTEPGDYEIQIQTDDVPIRGSPFKSRIADGNVRRSQVKLGSAVDFTLDITEKDISQLSASIMSPAGNNVPCLYPHPYIMKDGEHVNNSPISLSISQAEIGDTSKVKAFGPGLHTGQTFCTSEFVVDTWDAGYGGLTIVIEGPSKVDVHTEELEHGTCNISYCPIKAGNYKIAIKFSDEHIPGSPFTAVVTDRRLMRENITYNQKAAPIASIGSECSLAFKIPG